MGTWVRSHFYFVSVDYVSITTITTEAFFFKALNGRLPLEHSSDRRETSANRISDDLQFFVFRRWILLFGKKHEIFGGRFFFQLSGVLEELWGPKRHGHVVRKKLLPVVRLFLGRLPWRRGKRFNMCWNPRLGTENDFNHLVLSWHCHDNMIVFTRQNAKKSREAHRFFGKRAQTGRQSEQERRF